MTAAHLRGPATPPGQWLSGCTGKVGYRTRAEASKVARSMAGSKPPYRCKHCHQWHNTTQGKVSAAEREQL